MAIEIIPLTRIGIVSFFVNLPSTPLAFASPLLTEIILPVVIAAASALPVVTVTVTVTVTAAAAAAATTFVHPATLLEAVCATVLFV